MKKIIYHFIIMSFVGIIAAPASAQQSNMSVSDFKPLEGTWQGKLEYLDYSKSRKISIRTAARIVLMEEAFELGIDYPDEPSHNQKEVLKIGKEGMNLNDMVLIERSVQANGNLKIVVQYEGLDGNDNQPAVFNKVFIISSSEFSIAKMVKRKTDHDFFERNKYVFTRN